MKRRAFIQAALVAVPLLGCNKLPAVAKKESKPSKPPEKRRIHLFIGNDEEIYSLSDPCVSFTDRELARSLYLVRRNMSLHLPRAGCQISFLKPDDYLPVEISSDPPTSILYQVVNAKLETYRTRA